MSNSYKLGTDVKVFGRYQDDDGDDYDPAQPICKIKDSEGVETTYVYGVDAELVREAEGIYYLWVVPTTAGTWRYRFKDPDANRVANEEEFEIEPSGFDNP